MSSRLMGSRKASPAAAVLLASAAALADPVAAQDCTRPSLGDRLEVTRHVEGTARSSADSPYTLQSRARGYLVEATSDSIVLLETAEETGPARIPLRDVAAVRVHCGQHRLVPIALSAAAGALVGYWVPTFDPFGYGVTPEPGEQTGTAILGALIGASLGFAISSVTDRWVTASEPPAPGRLGTEQLMNLGPPPGTTRIAVGGALLTAGIAAIGYDSSLSDDGAPQLFLATGAALVVWGLMARSRR